MAQEYKKIQNLTYEELEEKVIGLENMATIANSKSIKELILKTIRETKIELEKRIKSC